MQKTFFLSSLPVAKLQRSTVKSLLILLSGSTAFAQGFQNFPDGGGYGVGNLNGAVSNSHMMSGSGVATTSQFSQDSGVIDSYGPARNEDIGRRQGTYSASDVVTNPDGDVRRRLLHNQFDLSDTKQEKTQFEKFVQQATGKQLPIYGQSLFNNPSAYQADSLAPVPDGHLVSPGDQIKLQTWGGFNYTGSLTVDRNGHLSIPSVGSVNLAGIRAVDLPEVLRQQIGKTYSGFEINATMERLRGIPVYVVGQARRPGTYTLPSTSTLVNALFASGGPSLHGSMRKIELKRNGQVVAQLDLYEFISKGDKRNDVALRAGDTIVIAPVGPRIALTGTLDHEAIYELKGGDNATSLGEVLELNGGTSVLADTSKALVESIDKTNAANTAKRKVAELALNGEGLQHQLQDGDIVTLLSISPAFSNAVTLQGNVAKPMRYRWFEGMRIRDLIPNPDALITESYYLRKNQLVQKTAKNNHLAEFEGSNHSYEAARGSSYESIANRSNESIVNGSYGSSPNRSHGFVLNRRNELIDVNRSDELNFGRVVGAAGGTSAGRNIDSRVRNMVDQVNWDYAVVERLDKVNLRTQLIPFNLGQAILHGDETQNLQLQPGDVVTILSQKDLKLPEERQTRMVRVEGEVAAPGLYQLLPGETLSQLLMRIGGVTPQAYLYGIHLERESVRQSQQENLDLLIRRLESQQQSQMLYLLANSSGDMNAQAAVMEQQQLMAKTQIEALSKLRSNGRISLELDPKYTVLTSLPDLPLEDSDRIVVPRIPAFISVAGAVNNENVFIYKPRRTVGDVIKVAGLREEADEKQIFVLRADGSISGKNNSGWFGGVDGIELMPGDTIVVPEKLDRETTRNFVVRQLKDFTQIISQFGLGVASIKVIQDL